MAINAGPSRAIKLLQKSAGVTADGKLGPKTLEAVKTVDNNSYVDARNNFYTGLVKQNPEKYSKFEKGWVNRSNSFKETAPEDPYQLPSPYEQRMKFAQQDPRRVDLAPQMAQAPAPENIEYASMEDLLMDRDLLGRSLLG
jgi:lysozyme family protein